MGEQLYRNPRPGDVLTMRDGRKRTVVEHDYFIRYQYTNGNGVSLTVAARPATWRETCSAELAKGGSYVRPEADEASRA